MRRHVRVNEFPFPSNGKVSPKKRPTDIRRHPNKVSIPFQRESPFGLWHSDTPRRFSEMSFHSLPTGKCIQRRPTAKELRSYAAQFPFPSNGKVYPKKVRRGNHNRILHCVSIPFKRESISKDSSRQTSVRTTGRFQFPSNGKVLSD